MPRPNIVFIYADDLDFDEIGVYDIDNYPCHTGAKRAGKLHPLREPAAYRDPRMVTPHIDSLARDGVTFSRFYLTSAVCTPSRYSLMTGRYASRSVPFQRKHPPGTQADIRWDTPLGPSEGNIAREMHNAGYKTGLVGKWHLGTGPVGRLRGIPPDADPYDPIVDRQIKDWYERGADHVRNDFGWDYAERLYFNNKEGLGLPRKAQVHNLEWVTEGATDFISQNSSNPFFLYMPLTTPHAQYSSSWLRADPRLCPAGVLDKAPDVMPSRESVFERLREQNIDERNAPGTWIDDCVGAVMKQLEESGVAGNTLLIFASDHQSRGKFTCTEGARVPFLARWPGVIEPGSEIGQICANIDFAPTLLEMAGAAASPGNHIDGESLLPLLRGQSVADWRESLLLEITTIRGVVSEDWKYIANRPPEEARRALETEALAKAATGELRRVSLSGVENPNPRTPGARFAANLDFPHYYDHDQLYSLRNDMFEQDNLAGDRSYEPVLEEHKEMMKQHLAGLPHTFGEFKTA